MREADVVSIPHWFDWFDRKVKQVIENILVSIPHWFDWFATAKLAVTNSNSFQFHIGSIGSDFFLPVTIRPQPRFNSTLVRLVLEETAYCSGSFRVFQFHIGSIGSNPSHHSTTLL